MNELSMAAVTLHPTMEGQEAGDLGEAIEVLEELATEGLIEPTREDPGPRRYRLRV